jgi:hypothetical protein
MIEAAEVIVLVGFLGATEPKLFVKVRADVFPTLNFIEGSPEVRCEQRAVERERGHFESWTW